MEVMTACAAAAVCRRAARPLSGRRGFM